MKLRKPKIKDYFDMIKVDDKEVQLRGGEDEILILKGAAVTDFYRILPFLDGTHKIAEIIAKLGDKLVAESLLARLYEYSIIEEGEMPKCLSSEEAVFLKKQLLFFSHKGNKYETQLRLKRSRVVIVSPDEMNLGKEVIHSLCLSGVGRITFCQYFSSHKKENSNYHNKTGSTTKINVIHIDGDLKRLVSLLNKNEVDLVIICLERVFPWFLREINKICVDTKMPWILLQGPSGSDGIVGPLFVPSETPCYNCLELRLKSNIEFFAQYTAFEKYLVENKKAGKGYGNLPAFQKILAGIGSIEILKYLTKFFSPVILGKFLTVNPFTHEIRSHRILKIPSCIECNRSRRPLSPWKAPLEN